MNSNRFEQIRRTSAGIGVHWTTWTLQSDGRNDPYERAVDAFDVTRFASQVAEAGAGHVLFTTTHALHHLPCPHTSVDALLSGRTCQRDLIADMVAALKRVNVALMLYYHHGCDVPEQDPEWQAAVGGQETDPTRLYSNIQNILATLGDRYRQDVIGWWFDAGWALDARPNTPWPALYQAARSGYDGRAVCFNPGFERFDAMTSEQDYWPGEAEALVRIPDAPTAPGGLPWYSFDTWYDRVEGIPIWGVNQDFLKLDPTPPPASAITAHLASYLVAHGAVTYNLPIYQSGEIRSADLKTFRQMMDLVRS